MIELPEAAVLARQLNAAISTKTIRNVTAAQSPHKFAWYSGDPAGYAGKLVGKAMGAAAGMGGMVAIPVQDLILVFSDGINLRYHVEPESRPLKHQLLVEFEDATALSVVVAMYGGLTCFQPEESENPYYLAARGKPSPLGGGFTRSYFESLFIPATEKLPLKAFLATEQRIPGLGNGVLQDILYRARQHPRSKAAGLGAGGRDALYQAIRDVLAEMDAGGGRDTERDLFGNPGGYITRLSKNTAGQPCPECGSPIQKQAYMGGSIYFCPGCQKES